MQEIPAVMRKELFQHGCLAVKREVWSAVRDFLTPDMFVPFMYVFYTTDIKHLEIPTLIRVQDRLTDAGTRLSGYQDSKAGRPYQELW